MLGLSTPRPQLVRNNWQNLNGTWQYAITPKDQIEMPTKWDGTILVPFCLESKLGGVQKLLQPNQTLWYRRVFDAKKTRRDKTYADPF